ncbi:LLM class F420-dependent oxidoreductase [Amycolatopsis sp. NPDC059090]|uniref:LLM class F420-dependent oxidoreductase n=1 Tax=unclassified Amycolatopsis TaxID=2618356 RepID=UPI003671D4EF
MKIGLNIGYWGAGNDATNLQLAQEADRLGFSVVWVAEAYGSDAATVLGWLAARTERVDLGSAILQIPARRPTMTAMTAATLDNLSGGRFRLGLGVSGPQVSEGWYGVPFRKPVQRTREYVDIVGKALRYERVRHDGAHFQLPLPGGPGKALPLAVPPAREHIPLYLAALGPQNLELTGEIADGWLGLFFSPEHSHESLDRIRAGREKAGTTLDGFDVATTAPLAVGDDWLEAADHARPYVAGFVGGAGSRENNFYRDLMARMGYEAAADEVRERYLTMDYAGAMAAIPTEFLDKTSLLGPKQRIADRMQALAESGVTTLALSPTHPDPEASKRALRVAAEALDASGVGD